MSANVQELILKDEAYVIAGCAMEVINNLGHGLLEKPYENVLVIEFKLRGTPYQQQPRYEVLYKGERVGEYVPDLVVYEKIVVDTKVVNVITDHERGQMLNYLKITQLRLGVILNFRRSRLEWERIVL